MTTYKFTKAGATLTDAQRQFYDENGYLLIPKLLREELQDELMQRFHEFAKGNVDKSFGLIIKDPHLRAQGATGEKVIFKIQDFLNDDVFFKYCQEKVVLDVVADIIGPDITAAHGMIFNKPPDTNPGFSLHPIHQDLYYFSFRPMENITAAWTALQDVDETNGCLYVLPGTHTLGLQPHGYVNEVKNLLYHGIAGFDDYPRINVTMEKGDIIFIHPLVLHGSGPNLSKGFRRAISCHFVNSNSHFISVGGTVQQDITGELLEIFRRKWGADMTLIEYYQKKSRLVKGPPGSFQTSTTCID